MKELCVVHLVRQQNGIEPFARFLESYRQNPGGVEHDLLIVFKGFGGAESKDEYLALLTPLPFEFIDVPDKGVDITAYFAVVAQYSDRYRYFCFLNSFSIILDNEWLKKLYQQFVIQQVGLVGATGSWQSHRTEIYRLLCVRVKNIGSWHSTKLRLKLVDAVAEDINLRNEASIWVLTAQKLEMVRKLVHYAVHYNSFPNYHLRTNAFMISGELMQNLQRFPINTKMDAYKFESGKSGLTMQVLRQGKKVLVVGKDGVGYEMSKWNESKTFWQEEQENLLVADNQTREYQKGNHEKRRLLSCFAWHKDCTR